MKLASYDKLQYFNFPTKFEKKKKKKLKKSILLNIMNNDADDDIKKNNSHIDEAMMNSIHTGCELNVEKKL